MISGPGFTAPTLGELLNADRSRLMVERRSGPFIPADGQIELRSAAGARRTLGWRARLRWLEEEGERIDALFD